ncbi:MAG: NAD(+)/NADH kinase [Neptunomonas phycophila]|uniref:NAD(+)/NADH kinase n=1 Tax=Neptunomonas phycophila TaxID=1572645 RepID=UPI003B8B921D
MNNSLKVHIVPKVNGEKLLPIQNIIQFIGQHLNLVDVHDIDDRTVVIAIGGDGTVIHAAKLAAPFNALVAGINLGHLGFLPDFENDTGEIMRLIEFIKEYPVGYESDAEWNDLVDLADKYQVDIEPRYMLSHTTNKGVEHEALNEFYITDKSNQVLKGEVYVDGALAFPFVGDGLIIGTPTGSTAYSLSAGGAIIDPKLRLIQITPVASHMLTSRPVIVGDSADVVVKVDKECEPIISVDGQEVLTRKGQRNYEFSIGYKNINDRVRIIRNRKTHVNIFNVLKDKLYFSSRND